MIIQHIFIFTIWMIVLASGYETNLTNDTTNVTDTSGKYESVKHSVVVNTG